MDRNVNSKRKLVKARDERLKTALKANMAKRKSQAKERAVDLSKNKDMNSN